MLTIKLSAFFVEFPATPSEPVQEIVGVNRFEIINGKYRVYDQPEKLYHILLSLSNVYDIEVI